MSTPPKQDSDNRTENGEFLEPHELELINDHIERLRALSTDYKVDQKALEDATALCSADLNLVSERLAALRFGLSHLFSESSRQRQRLEEAITAAEKHMSDIAIPAVCSDCGKRTYCVEESGRKVPLTVTGEVLYGRCLRCRPLQYLKRKAGSDDVVVKSVTFKATNNDVTPAAFEGHTSPTKNGIEKHSSFEAISKQEPGVRIIQHSSVPLDDALAPCSSGLVSAILHAYNAHHNLILRPDDVWQAVLNQFSLYLRAHAEELRDKIVDFKGQKSLSISSVGTLFTADFGELAARMVDEQVVSNIKDPEMVEWLLPKFSTTTPNDRIAASVSVMSSMQNYFKYGFELCCGIPSVTLLGSESDWAELRSKFDGLLRFEAAGKTYMRDWHRWLVGIGDEFVKSAGGEANVKFWDRVACHIGGGSGPRYISGWVSTFAAFSDKGEWQGATRKPMTFGGGYHKSDFPIINTNDLPSGVVSVPVEVNDNGTKFDCTMLSGQFGMRADGCTLSPSTDWCIVAKIPEVE